MKLYKVVIVKEHDEMSIEETLNHWTSQGWQFNTIDTEHTKQILIFEKDEEENNTEDDVCNPM